MTNQQAVFLEDLAEGDKFESGVHQLDEAQILAFAQQFDPQVFHLDSEAAKSTFFGGLAASGWHTAAITMRLIVDSVPFGAGIIGAGAQLEWPRPTRPSDSLKVICTVTAIAPSRSKPDRGMVTVECLTMNQADEVCQRMVTKLVVMRRKVHSTY